MKQASSTCAFLANIKLSQMPKYLQNLFVYVFFLFNKTAHLALNLFFFYFIQFLFSYELQNFPNNMCIRRKVYKIFVIFNTKLKKKLKSNLRVKNHLTIKIDTFLKKRRYFDCCMFGTFSKQKVVWWVKIERNYKRK